jgi:hypothetical protein
VGGIESNSGASSSTPLTNTVGFTPALFRSINLEGDAEARII